MKKISEYKEKDSKEISKEIDTKASMLGFDRYESGVNRPITNRFGLCNDCMHLQLAKSEFRILVARCYDFDLSLHSNDRVLECSNYEQRNSLSLNEMKDIAYIIESEDKTIGF